MGWFWAMLAFLCALALNEWIVRRDMEHAARRPADPYRLARWQGGEPPDPDAV